MPKKKNVNDPPERAVKNPFADLQKQKAENTEQYFKDIAGQDRPRSANDEKLEALNGQYSGMVTEVLTQLKDAVHPGADVISETCCWIIKYSMSSGPGIMGGVRHIETVVKVTLQTDADEKPTHFLCAVKYDAPIFFSRTRRRKSGLSREELTKTLAELSVTKPSPRWKIRLIAQFAEGDGLDYNLMGLVILFILSWLVIKSALKHGVPEWYIMGMLAAVPVIGVTSGLAFNHFSRGRILVEKKRRRLSIQIGIGASIAVLVLLRFALL